jgi:hypothetical protein
VNVNEAVSRFDAWLRWFGPIFSHQNCTILLCSTAQGYWAYLALDFTVLKPFSFQHIETLSEATPFGRLIFPTLYLSTTANLLDGANFHSSSNQRERGGEMAATTLYMATELSSTLA